MLCFTFFKVNKNVGSSSTACLHSLVSIKAIIFKLWSFISTQVIGNFRINLWAITINIAVFLVDSISKKPPCVKVLWAPDEILFQHTITLNECLASYINYTYFNAIWGGWVWCVIQTFIFIWHGVEWLKAYKIIWKKKKQGLIRLRFESKEKPLLLTAICSVFCRGNNENYMISKEPSHEKAWRLPVCDRSLIWRVTESRYW